MIVKSTILNFEDAIKTFNSFEEKLTLNSLSPIYVKLDSYRDTKLSPTYWFAKYNEYKYLHCFHLTKNDNYNIYDIESPYGYGGPISNTDNFGFLNAVSEEFKIWANKKNIIAEFIRFHPLMENYKWYIGELIENRKTIFIDLRKNLFTEYEGRRLTDVKRGIEKLSIEKIDFKSMMDIFPKMYFENMNDVKADKFYYFNQKYIKSLISNPITDNWIVKLQKNIVSATIIIKSEVSKNIEYHLSASNVLGRKHKASSYMIHSIANYYKNRGYDTFYLGGGRTSEENDTLLFFKRGFSKQNKKFYIGYRIFNSEKYNEIKNLNKKKFNNTKILFYKNI